MAIRAFQARVGITDVEEKTYGIIRPDGPTLIELVDLGDMAGKLERTAHAAKNPHNFIDRGAFDTDAFIEDFVKDGHFRAGKEANLRQFLGFLSRDPFKIDSRWMAYILATVFWENEAIEAEDTGKKNKAGKPIIRKVWLAQWSPVKEAGQGASRRYGTEVKVKMLADGTARVTEADDVGARAMVNGKDHAGDIARHAQKFEAILLKARKP